MCAAGCLTYKWIGSEDRLVKCRMRSAEGGMADTTWPRVLKEISAKLKQAPAGSVAIIASARQTNEELFLLTKLAAKFDALTDSVPRLGEGDKLLVDAA